jgi:DNA-binding CsgD family transcriptional regulator
MLNTDFPLQGNLRVPGDADNASSFRNFASLVLDEVANGLIVCDCEGRLNSANRTAWDELAGETALRLVDNRVRVASGSNAAFEEAVAAAAYHGRRGLLTLAGADRSMVAVIPLGASLAGAAPVLLVVGRRGVCSTLGLDMLALNYRLSAAERRVMGALVERTPPREIAARHGVAMSTVRSQIKSIRDKLGVANIEGIFVRAAEVPPVAVAWRRMAFVERRRDPARLAEALARREQTRQAA